jgi:hypothetical protein
VCTSTCPLPLPLPAVKTYSHCLKDIDDASSPVAVWATQPAPEIAVKYWRLAANATVRDLILAVRADEVRGRRGARGQGGLLDESGFGVSWALRSQSTRNPHTALPPPTPNPAPFPFHFPAGGAPRREPHAGVAEVHRPQPLRVGAPVSRTAAADVRGSVPGACQQRAAAARARCGTGSVEMAAWVEGKA